MNQHAGDPSGIRAMRSVTRWPLLLVLLLMATTSRTQKSPRAPAAPKSGKLSAESERWVAQTLKQMSLDEKIGQLFAVWVYGSFLSTESQDYTDLLRDVQEKHIGSFAIQTQGSPLGIAERSQVYPTAILINTLQKHAKVPLLVGADFERGTGMRIDEGTAFPHNMAVAATGRPEDAYTMGKITALEAKAAGVPWVFAPDADVNSNPENPIINTRSFGEDPARVSEFVAAFVRGVEENGGLATAKHFPGHGDTSTDSHLDLPTVTVDRAHLDRVELAPFRAAIAAGAGSIMTGHLAVPVLEPDPNVPATMSRKITTDLLRGEMGFNGLVVTDALDMGGVTVRYPPGEVAVRSILAGSDILLVPPVLDAALQAVRDAVASGRIPMARIDESVTRVLRAKAKLGLNKSKLVDLDALARDFDRPEYDSSALDIADRGITLLRDDQHILPLDATKPQRVLLVAVSGDSDPFPAGNLENEIRWRVDSLATMRMDTRFVRADTVKLPSPDSYDVAIAAIFVRVADRKGSIGLPDDEVAVVNRLLASGKPVVVACFGSPYLAERFPSAKTWIAAFSTVEIAQRAMGRALFGQTAVGGRLPVHVPSVAALGAGLDLAANPMELREASSQDEEKLQRAYDVLGQAVNDHAFPGGILAVGYKGELIVHEFGRQTYDANSPTINVDTMYDAASLTKPVVTATLFAMQVEAGRIGLDLPVSRYLPEWNDGPNPDWRKAVTVRNLLTHSSGLPAHREYFLSLRSKREFIAAICREPLEYAPGTKTVYSDLGFILLGEILERTTGKTVDQLARERIFAPLDMTSAMFNPPKNLVDRIAPTENDTTFRKRLVHGVVHDENAFAMGGVSGHAGMFATAGDLATFCQMMLNGGIYGHHRLLTRATVSKFTSAEAISGNARTLGWMVPTTNSSSGRYFSPHSYGHLGYAGTSIWIDPDRQLFVILLTNRVYPTRENDKITAIRPAVHDAVIEALGLASPAK
ncbi:MAG TPA: glycoside hydrolase family 3 N-terminal domain-containing protein [Verrucomicrobiae bacterium]|jgi:beta-N-acetylhexosaminidase|nr:glycoside hydrolase family 3 N-terminal domain-containing protein [Verrucomicrobiae bacterium]